MENQSLNTAICIKKKEVPKTLSKLQKGWSKLKRSTRFISRKMSKKNKIDDSVSYFTNKCKKKSLNHAKNQKQLDEGEIYTFEEISTGIVNSVTEPSSKISKLPTKERVDVKKTLTGRSKDNVAPHRLPTRGPQDIQPPQSLKADLFTTPEIRFRELDRLAIQFAKRRCCDLEKVSLRLTHSCESDLEKARVLFRWVVAKDLISRQAKQLNWTVSTVGDVRDKNTNREMFHRMYQTMCGYVGLRCEIIQGYSKGTGYKPGMRINKEAFRNCWTAVAVDRTWRLVNCTWAARNMTSTRLSSCDEFYFFTDPQKHIFQHFPDEPQWQLLKHPLPFREFSKLPLVQSPFFNNSLRFLESYTSKVVSHDGQASISMTVPNGVKVACGLKASVSSDILRPTEAGVSLKIAQKQATFTVQSCRPGLYYLSIYATSTSRETKSLEIACVFGVKFTDFNSHQL